MKTKYIVFEGTEGVGKTTQTGKIVEYLISEGNSVLHTKEPGTLHSPLTMTLRGIMLDNQYDAELTQVARELISQSIRSIHLEKVIKPAIGKYDYIIQDRGILSGLSYGAACGNDIEWLLDLATKNVDSAFKFDKRTPFNLYDTTIYLTGDVSKNLNKAKTSKQEFTTGDAMESRGSDFLKDASNNMDRFASGFSNVTRINVDDKDIEQVFAEIRKTLQV